MEELMKKYLSMLWDGIVILWEDYLLYLRFVLYAVVIIFLIIGAAAAFTGALGLGIFLIAFNAFLLLLMLKLSRSADADFEKDFQEMVRKNLEEQNLTDEKQKL